jgi:hypothetical protein
MSAKNPKRALAAVTAAGERVHGELVREITLGTAAVLERIDSPLFTGVPEGRQISLCDMLPTIYVMTRPAVESEELLADGFEALKREAVRWADGFSTRQGMDLAAACARAARRVRAAAPSGVPDKEGAGEGNGRSAGTAGCSPSPPCARNATAGRGRKSTTASRCA